MGRGASGEVEFELPNVRQNQHWEIFIIYFQYHNHSNKGNGVLRFLEINVYELHKRKDPG
jgi:hypothetical protein